MFTIDVTIVESSLTSSRLLFTQPLWQRSCGCEKKTGSLAGTSPGWTKLPLFSALGHESLRKRGTAFTSLGACLVPSVSSSGMRFQGCNRLFTRSWIMISSSFSKRSSASVPASGPRPRGRVNHILVSTSFFYYSLNARLEQIVFGDLLVGYSFGNFSFNWWLNF